MNLRDLLRQNTPDSIIDVNAIMGGLVADPNRDNTGALINPEQVAQVKTPQIKSIQLNDNGLVMSDEDIQNNKLRLQAESVMNAPLSVREKLFGAERPQTYTIAQLKDGNSSEAQPQYDDYKKVNNGWLNDFADGYKDNYNNGFKVSNWNDDPKAKNIAQRLGEGLGSAMRFIDSPMGRMAITSGLGLAMGSTPGQALSYGINAGNIHNKLQIDDKAYRNLLEEQGLDTSKLGNGWVDKELAQTYALNNYRNGMLANKNLKLTYDQYKTQMTQLDQMYRNGQISPMQYAQYKAELGQMFKNSGIQTGIDYNGNNLQTSNQTENSKTYKEAVKQQGEQGWARVGLTARSLDQQAEQNRIQNAKLSDTQLKDLTTSTQAMAQLDNIIKKYSDEKYNDVFGLLGAAKRNPITSKFSPKVSELRQDVDLFRKSVAKAVEGGRLTDQDQIYYEKALLNPNLSREEFVALAKKYKNTLIENNTIMLNNLEKQGNNVDAFKRNGRAF